MLKLPAGLALACLVTPAVAAGPACPGIGT